VKAAIQSAKRVDDPAELCEQRPPGHGVGQGEQRERTAEGRTSQARADEEARRR